MTLLDKFIEVINDAQIASAAVYPTSPYTGKLPTKAVKKGSKGTNVKRVQRFLNWCIKAGLPITGKCGKKTVSAIKKFQKQYGLKADGIFGTQSKKKAQSIINKYKVEPKPTPAPTPAPAPAPAPTPAPTPTPTLPVWTQKANAWARKIAADNSYHYVLWTSKTASHECPICKKHKKGKYHGWNCIGFAFAVWHHGAGFKNKCSCYAITNQIANQMYKAKSTAAAEKIIRERLNMKDIKVIRNKKGIPKSQWKPGDICLKFGKSYQHTFYYMGDGKIADSTGSSGKVANDKQIAVRSYKKYKCKIILRYTGK